MYSQELNFKPLPLQTNKNSATPECNVDLPHTQKLISRKTFLKLLSIGILGTLINQFIPQEWREPSSNLENYLQRLGIPSNLLKIWLVPGNHILISTKLIEFIEEAGITILGGELVPDDVIYKQTQDAVNFWDKLKNLEVGSSVQQITQSEENLKFLAAKGVKLALTDADNWLPVKNEESRDLPPNYIQLALEALVAKLMLDQFIFTKGETPLVKWTRRAFLGASLGGITKLIFNYTQKGELDIPPNGRIPALDQLASFRTWLEQSLSQGASFKNTLLAQAQSLEIKKTDQFWEKWLVENTAQLEKFLAKALEKLGIREWLFVTPAEFCLNIRNLVMLTNTIHLTVKHTSHDTPQKALMFFGVFHGEISKLDPEQAQMQLAEYADKLLDLLPSLTNIVQAQSQTEGETLIREVGTALISYAEIFSQPYLLGALTSDENLNDNSDSKTIPPSAREIFLQRLEAKIKFWHYMSVNNNQPALTYQKILTRIKERLRSKEEYMHRILLFKQGEWYKEGNV